MDEERKRPEPPKDENGNPLPPSPPRKPSKESVTGTDPAAEAEA